MNAALKHNNIFLRNTHNYHNDFEKLVFTPELKLSEEIINVWHCRSHNIDFYIRMQPSLLGKKFVPYIGEYQLSKGHVSVEDAIDYINDSFPKLMDFWGDVIKLYDRSK